MRGAALIVLAWNQWPLTRRCLDSLLASDLDQAEVIVVDNGSSDDTPTALAAYAERVRIVALPENFGFVRGMNAGIAAARADDDIVLLNNDLVFTQADWLGRLRDAAYASPDTGIVGCRLLGPEAEPSVYHVGGFIEPDTLRGEQTETGTIERDVGQYLSTRRVQAIAFAVAYIRRDCIARIGRLDEAFHSYFEDTDYCLRAADAGIATVNAGAVTLRHDQHGSTQADGGFRQRLFAQSRATFAARWRERLREHHRGDVLWHGVSRFPRAYAELARLLVRRLDARGLRMAYARVHNEFGDAEDRRLDLAATRKLPARPEVGLVCAPAPRFAAARGRLRVGIAFGEWVSPPRAWADGANALDLLLVPDAFQRDAFKQAGVRSRIELLPLGVDRDYCHSAVPAPREPHGDFVFIASVEDFARDAPDVLVAAFRAAFRADDPVQLIVHVQPGPDAARIGATIAASATDRGGRTRVIDGWSFPFHQRAQLLSSADAYVSARRGGGWDPRIAEAIACGRQVIAPDFGSARALLRANGIAFAFAALVEDARHRGCLWAEPDRDALIDALRSAVARRDRMCAIVERDHVAATAGPDADVTDIDATADALVARLAEAAELRPARPRPRPHRPVDAESDASGQIVVLGMHRSGTSSVAGLLARMGVAAGPGEDLLIGPDNPKGHYESTALHGACLRRLAAAGGDWQAPPDAAPPVAVDAFRRAVAALLDGFDAGRPWLIKEPRLCLLVRELLPLLTRPLFVHVVRDPAAVAASLGERDGLDREHALALWTRYNHAAFDATRGWPRLLINYAELIAEPLTIARALHDRLHAFGIDAVTMPAEAVVRDWIDAPKPIVQPAQDAQPSAAALAAAALWARIRDGSVLDDDATADVGANAGKGGERVGYAAQAALRR